MKKHRKARTVERHVARPDLGTPPGSPVYVGERKPTDMVLSVIGYDPIGSWARSALTVDELLTYRNTGGVNWINVNGLKDVADIERLAQAYKIHPLTVEDILNTAHRPKVEEFDEYLFITLKAITLRGGQPVTAQSVDVDMNIDYEQMSVILTRDTVITFQEQAGDSFDPIRRRIEVNVGRIRKMGPDYLAYGIVDSIVDSYFIVLDQLGTRLEEFEMRATEESGQDFIRELQGIKQEVVRMRRSLWPLRESIAALLRMESTIVTDELDPFLKDLHDNVVQAAETIESYRELIASILEVNLSSVSNRMNEVMKVLTIISTIFIPLTFIVGVYGMNFRYMPELSQPWGYPAAWGAMGLIALGMIIFFKKRKWL